MRLLAAMHAYTPATDILFFVQQGAAGTFLGLRATPPRLPPCRTAPPAGTPPRVVAA